MYNSLQKYRKINYRSNIEISKNHIGEYTISDFKDLDFNIYIIIKKSNRFRVITKEEFLSEKYCGVLLIEKDKYDYDDLNKWLGLANLKDLNIFKFINVIPTISFEKIHIMN